MPDKKFGKDTKDGDVDYESNFYIIKKSLCPAVLTENFFYTCRENLDFLTTDEGR
jgi:N-acetylmuramoyl-L-alanine amidase